MAAPLSGRAPEFEPQMDTDGTQMQMVGTTGSSLLSVAGTESPEHPSDRFRLAAAPWSSEPSGDGEAGGERPTVKAADVVRPLNALLSAARASMSAAERL